MLPSALTGPVNLHPHAPIPEHSAVRLPLGKAVFVQKIISEDRPSVAGIFFLAHRVTWGYSTIWVLQPVTWVNKCTIIPETLCPLSELRVTPALPGRVVVPIHIHHP